MYIGMHFPWCIFKKLFLDKDSDIIISCLLSFLQGRIFFTCFIDFHCEPTFSRDSSMLHILQPFLFKSPPGNLPDTGIRPMSLMSLVLAGRFFNHYCRVYIDFIAWDFFLMSVVKYLIYNHQLYKFKITISCHFPEQDSQNLEVHHLRRGLIFQVPSLLAWGGFIFLFIYFTIEIVSIILLLFWLFFLGFILF